MTWTNQMAAVTGAGIGRTIAQMLASRGALVATIDLDIVTATETVDLITQTGGRAASYQADVSQSAEIDRAIPAAAGDLGPLHIMVNNAGILDGYFNVDETDEDLWRRVIDYEPIDAFTVMTGQVASRTSCSATLPMTTRVRPVRPWVPITMRSTC